MEKALPAELVWPGSVTVSLPHPPQMHPWHSWGTYTHHMQKISQACCEGISPFISCLCKQVGNRTVLPCALKAP